MTVVSLYFDNIMKFFDIDIGLLSKAWIYVVDSYGHIGSCAYACFPSSFLMKG